MDEVFKDITLLVVGAGIALFSNWASARIERETSASNELFNLRVNALNEIWLEFIQVRDVYARKAQEGHEAWIKNHKDDAQNKLDSFRRLVDAKQVVLPPKIIEKLRDIDSYLFSLLSIEDQNPSEYQEDINRRLKTLSNEVNESFKKRTHAIDLHFRT